MKREISSYAENNFLPEFQELISIVKPKLIVEFGIGNGYSLVAFDMFTLRSQCKIHAYDLFDKYEYSHADKASILDRFAQKDIVIGEMDFYSGFVKYKEGSIDILHIDISNTGDTYEFAMENYWPCISPTGAIVFEGGSTERDQVEWMTKFNKRPIVPYLDTIRDKYRMEVVQKFPSMTIIYK